MHAFLHYWSSQITLNRLRKPGVNWKRLRSTTYWRGAIRVYYLV